MKLLPAAQKDAVLKYVHADVVKVIHSTDGKSLVEFLRRHDGLYEYRGHVELVDDGPYGKRALLVVARTLWALRDNGRTRTGS